MSDASRRQYARRLAQQRFEHNAGLLELELVRGTAERRILLALLELCGLCVEQTGPVTGATQPLWERFGRLHKRVHDWRPKLEVVMN